MSADAPVPASRLLTLASDRLDPGALGALVALLADELFPARPRAGVVALARAGGLEDLFSDADFVAAVGRARLKSARLIRAAFDRAPRAPSAAIARVAGMAAAGALNVFSTSALAALHAGAAGWRAPALAELAGRLAEGLDSFAAAGLFLARFLAAPGAALEPAAAAALARAVCARRDVRDLAGAPADLLEQLPAALAGDVEDELLARDASDESDADEEGNLAGFVVDDGEGEEEEDDDEDDEDEDEDDDDADRGRGGRGGIAPIRAPAAPPSPSPRVPAGFNASRFAFEASEPAGGALFDALCELGAAAPSPLARPAAARAKRPRAASPARGRGGGGGGGGGGGRAAAARARYIESEAGVGRGESD